MKLAKRIAAVLLIIAAVLFGIRAYWTVSNGIDGAKEFFYGFVGKEATPSASDGYSNIDGFVTQTKRIPLAGVNTISLEIDAAIVSLRTGGSNEIVVEAKYGEKSFFAENVFIAESKSGTATISFKMKNFVFSFGERNRNRASNITVTIPASFSGNLKLDFNACTVDGVTGNAKSISLGVNAGAINLRGISGSLTASMNASDSSFTVQNPAGNISISLTAGKTVINLPLKSNYRISNSTTAGKFTNNYDSAVNRTGKEFALNATGTAAQIEVNAR